MPRPPFNVLLSSPCKYNFTGHPSDISVVVMDARQSSETSSGTSRRKPKGWVAPTSYSLRYRSLQKAEGSAQYYYVPNPPSNYQNFYGCVGGNTAFSSDVRWNSMVNDSDGSIVDSSLANRALIKARLKLKATNVNLGVAFAERNQTARLLGDTASRIGKAFREVRRGRLRPAMDHLGISSRKREPRGSNVTNKWLELQYGWKPLLSDVFGAASALEKRDASDWRVTAKATVPGDERVYTVEYAPPAPGFGRAVVNNSCFCRIDALPSNAATIALSSLGVTNPLLIAWELVPFSFVVDWALPVGSWLESLDALLGYDECYTSTSTFTNARWESNSRTTTVGQFFYFGSWHDWKVVKRLVRSASAGVPLPTFPRIKDPSSLTHMANGLALLASSFGRR